MSERLTVYATAEATRSMPRLFRITEAQLLAAVRDFVLRVCRGMFYHPWRSDHSEAGFPDCTIIIGTRLIFAELKRDGKEPTDKQRRWLERLSACRTIEVYCWHGAELDKARAILQGDTLRALARDQGLQG